MADEPADMSSATLEDVLHRFGGFVGERVSHVARQLAMESSVSKSFAANVVRRAMASCAPGGSLDRVAGGAPTVRVPRVDADLMPYEPLSFPAFSHVELVNETWPTSSLRAETERMVFAPIQGRAKETPQGDCILLDPIVWIPDDEEMEILQREWEMFRDLIRSKRSDELPTASSTHALHIRPHGRDSSDTDLTTSGGSVTKKSFWLNRKFVREILTRSD
jgi:hypothetical protein